MFDNFFANPTTIITGAVTGLVFGFLLQKAGVSRYNIIVNQFRLRDFTVVKTMLSAIIVGSIGIYAMLQMGWISGLHIKSAELGMNIGGGLIFGVGMAVLGYCPGTALAAIGQGSRDAIIGVLGALCGAAVYAEAYPSISSALSDMGNLGMATFANEMNISPWWLIACLTLVSILLFMFLEKREEITVSSS